MTYLVKRYCDVDITEVKNVLERMKFEEKVCLKRAPHAPKEKRQSNVSDGESFQGSPKRRKLSQTPSPMKQDGSVKKAQHNNGDGKRSTSRRERLQAQIGEQMEEELKEELNVKDEEEQNPKQNIEREKESRPSSRVTQIVARENESRILSQNRYHKTPASYYEHQAEQETQVKISESHSKRDLIDYYEKRLISKDPVPAVTGKAVVKEKSKISQLDAQGEQSEVMKQEEEQEVQRRCEISRFEVNEEDTLGQSRVAKKSLGKTSSLFLENFRVQSNNPVEKTIQNAGRVDDEENLEKIKEEEEEKQKGMVMWENQRKVAGDEANKQYKPDDNRIELLMKLLESTANTRAQETQQNSQSNENAGKNKQIGFDQEEVPEKIEEEDPQPQPQTQLQVQAQD